MKCIRLFRIGALTLGLCCLHAMVNGQSNDQGLIRGTVSDSRGAVIPGANVTLIDVGTNVSKKPLPTTTVSMSLPDCGRRITGC